jgi:cation transport ATPase
MWSKRASSESRHGSSASSVIAACPQFDAPAGTMRPRGFVYFDFVSTFTFLMLVGRWLQQKALERNRAQLLAGQNEPPPVLDAATGTRISAAQLTPGTAFSVAPGQLVPVRSRLDSEAATLNLEWISGESEAAMRLWTNSQPAQQKSGRCADG